MTFRARDSTWQLQLDDVLKTGGVTGDVSNGIQSDEVIMTKYKELLKKRTRLWWNKAFLGKYLEKDLVPRGLRVQVFPSFPLEDEAFKTKWEELAQTCSRGFLGLLWDHNSTSLVSIEAELEALEKSLTETCTPTVVTRFYAEIDKELEKWEQEIRTFKLKKLNRDIQDYTLRRAYRWRNNTIRGRSGDTANKNPRLRSSSLVSMTSAGGSSSGASVSSMDLGDSVGARVKHRNRPQVTYNKNKRQGNKLQRNDGSDSAVEREAIRNLEDLLQEQEIPTTGPRK
ncbi:uncharacterized protein ACNLHF_011785 [Anomaloglossus baeobatrachus]